MGNENQSLIKKMVPAKELARLPVHKLAEVFPMESEEDLQRLAESLAQGQEMPVLVNDGVVIDGRNRIAAGAINNLDLQVTYYSGLTETEIKDKIQKLNIKRRNLPAPKRVELALAYYQEEKAAGRKVSYEKAADRFNASKRTLYRILADQKPGRRPPVLKPSLKRIPDQFRDMYVALSNLSMLRNTEEGRREIRGFSARIKILARDILSRPELRTSVERSSDVFD